MKKWSHIMKLVLYLIPALLVVTGAGAASTINPTNNFAYGANIGWLNARADGGTNGAVIGEFYCSGYIYSANVGWISLGVSNGPVNGYSYSNINSNDWGVNTAGGGQLFGIAYSANVGWITFEQTFGQPRVDLLTGNLAGSVYSANCGWISLSNSVAVLQTDSISSSPLDVNGLPIAWEEEFFGTTNINANADPDGDGLSNAQEYQAGTNPTDPTSRLRLTAITANTLGSTATLTWTSVPSRLYQVQERLDLAASAWGTNLTLGVVVPDPGSTTTRGLTEGSVTKRFFRVQVIKPLSP